jgi:hypothetical protein
LNLVRAVSSKVRRAMQMQLSRPLQTTFDSPRQSFPLQVRLCPPDGPRLYYHDEQVGGLVIAKIEEFILRRAAPAVRYASHQIDSLPSPRQRAQSCRSEINIIRYLSSLTRQATSRGESAKRIDSRQILAV